MTRMRRPAWWSEGTDPDYRFSLANERTFLAWLRTSLSLLAGSVAIVQLVPSFRVGGARTVLGALLALAGLASAVLAYVRWASTERSMRLNQPLPYSQALRLVAAAVAGAGAAILLLVLFSHR